MAAPWLLQALYTSLLSVSSGPRAAGDTYVMVNTTHGVLRGQVDYTLSPPLAKFQGIRYAAPPTGALRFQPPSPAASWTGVRDALTFGHICMQTMLPGTTSEVQQSEDCLYLNVFTPVNVTVSDALPVMVFIHGGAYYAGASSMYDLRSLTSKGVIVVSLNYRLNYFGFLSTEDDVMPGNYGMLDMIQALRWVKGNIHYFGGDQNRVTIFGQSAGGGSVSLLMLSPLAKNLFHRSISQSGTSLNQWSTAHPGDRISAKTMTRLVGSQLHCDDLDNSTKLMTCLQSADAESFFNASESIKTAVDSEIVLTPRVETTFGFLPDLPINLLSRGQVNPVETVTGYTSDEMAGVLYMQMQKYSSNTDIVEGTLHYFLRQFTELSSQQVERVMKATFITNNSTDEGRLRGALDAVDASYFVSAAVAEANLLARTAPMKQHYMYEFSYKPSPNPFPYPAWTKAAHGDELTYLFNVSVTQMYNKHWNMSVTPEMTAVSSQVMEMWTNFAKTGNPSLVDQGGFTWEPFTAARPSYMFMDNKPELKMLNRLDLEDFFKVLLHKLDGIGSGTPGSGVVG